MTHARSKELVALALAAGALAILMALPSHAAEPKEEGWTPLFNGKNLDGWIQRGGKAKYRVDGNETAPSRKRRIPSCARKRTTPTSSWSSSSRWTPS